MKKNKLAKMAAAVLMTGSIATLGTSKVNAEDGASATSKQSTATFTIDTSKAKLTLDKVPSFDFGSVDPADIYAKKTVSSKGSGEIQVTDTRLNATGWNLAVSTTTALTNSSSSIEGDLTFTPTSFLFTTGNATSWTFSSGTPTLNLPSTSSAEIASSIGKDKGTGSATVSSANLKFTKNNTLAQGKYTSNLTWNLGTTTDESGRASE
ncbi:WxL domain-containing protein [Lactobacillus crispatus]|uniref:WxL domain-containing protein n=1 Tax=Lactobacillus crispatus TaxID=47770 RepID=UPI0039F64ADA